MVIGVHAVAAFQFQPTGVEVYVREFLEALAKLPDVSSHRFLLYIPTPPQGGRDPDFLGNVGANFQKKILRAPALWTQVRLSWEMLRRPPDVLFVPAQALPRVLPKRTVVTIHGLEFEQFPRGYSRRHRAYLRFVTRDAVRRADAVIAVSEATKRDLVNRYGVLGKKIFVIHHGVPHPPMGREIPNPTCPPTACRPQATGRRESQIPNPYFLYLGRLETKKGVDVLIRAFARFSQRMREPFHLVLAGAEGFGFKNIIRPLIENSSVRDRIRVAGYVSEEEKQRLLRNATALVLPSWAEGFGFPILEAQASGTPVITGTATAMPEIAGSEGALFVEPGDDAALASALERIANDAPLRARLVAAGRENVRRFSWQKTAERTLRVLLGVVE